jgi:DNA-binding beta-propeller fold protein YncE
MVKPNFSGRLALLLAVVLLAGCASAPVPGLFTTEVRGFDPERPAFFPPYADRDVPRYRYLGELIGDDNFLKERTKNRFYRAIEWITGAVFGQATPRELRRPQSGAVGADGRIFVTDVGAGAVFVFDTAAGLLDVFEYAEPGRRFESPIGVAVGQEGELYVTDSALGLVAHLAADGRPLAPLGVGTLKRPTGVVHDPRMRELLVADTANHEIVVFDTEGHSVKRRISERGEGWGGVNFPTFMALEGDELFVADTMNARIAVFDRATGRMLRQVGQRGNFVGQLVRPKGVALDSEGNLYVVESYHDYLLVFDREGRLLLPIGGNGNRAGTMLLPSGVWVDERDRVFVADVFNGRVIVLQFLGGEENGQPAVARGIRGAGGTAR